MKGECCYFHQNFSMETCEKIKQARSRQIIIHSEETKKMAESRRLYWQNKKMNNE